MVEVWFGLLCFMLTMFIVMDGWDIGAGTAHLLVAKSDEERRTVIAAIGPLWSWHEVWLVASGATFLLAFPKAMALSFSAFYLALWMALWSLILRGISIEVRGHIADRMWQSFWDFMFAVANVLLAVLFGAALGNVIRGVPLDDSGTFSMPLFTDFRASGRVGLLDWYTISVAVFVVILLAAHGTTFLAAKTTGLVHGRSRRSAVWLWSAVLLLFPLISVGTWIVRPEMYTAMAARPIAWLAIAAMLAGASAVASGLKSGNDGRAFGGSCAVIAGLIAGLAIGVFPVLLHSTLDSAYSLSAYDAATGSPGLAAGLIWWPVAVALALSYLIVVARTYRGRVGLKQDTQS